MLDRGNGISQWARQSIMLLVVAALLVGLLAPPAQAQNLDSRVLPQLQREAKERPNQGFRIIVTRMHNDRAADQALAALGGRKIKDVATVGFAAQLPGRAIAALGRNPAVKFVSYDAPMLKTGTVDYSRLATLYPEVVKATNTWNANGNKVSRTGLGVTIAVLDTGIAEAFSGGLRGDWKDANGASRIVKQMRFNANTASMNDAHGHGTAVAGVIGGNSWYHKSRSLRGKYIGIAPEANLINVKVSDDQGMSYVSDVVNAIEWVIANRETYNIRVMNLSLISSIAESYKTSVLSAAAERAWFNGIFVVVAAGNSGPNTMQYAPANDPFVMTVGAADPMGTASASDDTVAPWSSYGMTQDGVSKPDVVAPGRYMVVPLASGGSTLAKALPDRIVDSEYIRMSGTSFAAPVVAGIAALILEAHPEWTNDQIKWLLIAKGKQLGTQGSFLVGQGAGQVDAWSTVYYNETPQYANQGLTISDWLVTTDGTTNYSSANWSSANWSSANWSSANWSSANWSSANWSSANWSTANFLSTKESVIE
jgi:serine protease AprX